MKAFAIHIGILNSVKIFKVCLRSVKIFNIRSHRLHDNDRGAFFLLGGLTSDLKWGALETLLLESLYFFGNIGGG